MDYRGVLQEIGQIARDAGELILTFTIKPGEHQVKEDRSPVSAADLAANRYIEEKLLQLQPDIPIVSEEGDKPAVSAATPAFWLVDPLDGTKSYLRGKGEYSVNIGLIERGVPVLGTIYIPPLRQLYIGGPEGAFLQERDQPLTALRTRKPAADGIDAVVSHSHLDQETLDLLQKFTVRSRVSAASSLKFCRVAEGAADLYPRFGPTMEWDTAAGHAILLAAGGRMTNIDGSPFLYGKPSFKNPGFIAYGN